MRGRGVWVLGGLLVGCLRSPTPAPVAPIVPQVPSPSAVTVAVELAPPPRPACSLPDEVAITVHGDDVLVNGAHVEQLTAAADRPTALTRLLIPCRDHGIHFLFELEARGSAQLTSLLLHELPRWSTESGSVRFGSSPAVPLRIAPLKSSADHWVRLVVGAERIRALELERGDGPGAARIIHEVEPRTLADAYAFLHATCAKSACLGVVLSFATDSKNTLIESALEAIRSPQVQEPLLVLRDDSTPDSEGQANLLSPVSGRLPPELIQSVVRKSYGRFRTCYEQGLARDPKLQGRVSARFVIELDGTVSHAANGGSDLTDPEVINCVISQFFKLEFPPPDGGIVTVVYPIMLSPG
jgi:hypothetical protein